MINLKYKKCSVSISGDYYQIMFDDDYDEPDNYDDINEVINSIGPYFFVQFILDYDSPQKTVSFQQTQKTSRLI